MATFRKRGETWRAEIVRIIDGNRIRISETFPTKTQAMRWATWQEAELDKSRHAALPAHLSSGDETTLETLLEDYRDTVSPTKRGARWEHIRITSFINQFPQLCAIRAAKLTPDHLATWRDARLSQVSAATVNREMNIISAALEHARRERRIVSSNPCRDVRRPPQPKHRQQRISDADRDAIVSALGFDGKPPTQKRQQVAIMFLISLETGMRAGELTALRWRDVHLQKKYLTIAQSKNGDKRDIPLSSRARELLELMRGIDDERAFTVSDAERDALFRKYRPDDLAHINYHDSRHEAVTRLAKRLDVLELARMIGHRDLKSLMVYYNATASELASKLD